MMSTPVITRLPITFFFRSFYFANDSFAAVQIVVSSISLLVGGYCVMPGFYVLDGQMDTFLPISFWWWPKRVSCFFTVSCSLILVEFIMPTDGSRDPMLFTAAATYWCSPVLLPSSFPADPILVVLHRPIIISYKTSKRHSWYTIQTLLYKQGAHFEYLFSSSSFFYYC